MTAPAQGMPQLEDPAAAGGKRPRIADAAGRTVMIQPLKIERGLPGLKPGETQDRITANLTVIDGGPLQFGGKPEKHQPHTMTVSTPYTAEGVYISQVGLINALSDALPSPKKPNGGVVVGVIVQGAQPKDPAWTPPWLIQTLDEKDPRRAAAQQVLAAMIQGHFTNPEPIDITTGVSTSAMPAAVHNPGQPTQYTTTAGIQAAMQQAANPTSLPAQHGALQQNYPGYAPGQDPQYLAWQAQQAAQQQAAQQAPAVDPQYQAYLAAQQQAAAPVQSPTLPQGQAPYVVESTVPQGPNGAAPTGWPQDAWDRLTATQATAIRGSTG